MSDQIRRVRRSEKDSVATAIRVLTDRGIDVPEPLLEEGERLGKHLDVMAQFGDRMQFGSALSGHAEDVLNWLIEQGWMPPQGLFLMEPTLNHGDGDE